MKREIILTKDGSHTVHIPDMEVTYHSRHGAVQESMHVFIQSGLHYCWEKFPDKELRLFEMGLGTGLNALLTALEAEKQQRKILYTAVEQFPLSAEEAKNLNYQEVLSSPQLLQLLHASNWNTEENISPFFRLRKVNSSLQDYLPTEPVHLIYYDAFAPGAQPELWTEEIFRKLHTMLANEGVLVTYCSKSNVRRAMQAAGFAVSKLPGPPGKREILRAEKKA